MSHIILALVFNAVLVTVCGCALIWGGRPEKIGAAINLAAAGVTTALQLSDIAYFGPAAYTIVAIDVVVACGFYWLGVTTIRFWPLWAAGFAGADLFMDCFGALLPRLPVLLYQSGLGIYAYLALGALAVGTLRLPRDAEPYLRNGSRQSWLQHMKQKN